MDLPDQTQANTELVDEYRLTRQTLRSFLSEEDNVKYPTNLDKMQILGARVKERDELRAEVARLRDILNANVPLFGHSDTTLNMTVETVLVHAGNELVRMRAEAKRLQAELNETHGLERERDELRAEAARLRSKVIDILNSHIREEKIVQESLDAARALNRELAKALTEIVAVVDDHPSWRSDVPNYHKMANIARAAIERYERMVPKDKIL
jgi:hypothetical protein